MIDLTGEKFGKLTVLKRLHYSQSGHSYFWECECDCGNKIIVLGSNLKRKHTQSCGCYNKESLKQRTEDLTGQKYGRLTVLKRMENDKWGQSCWLCLCECGNTIMVTRGRLKNGHTTSCGCIRTQRTSNLNKTHGLCCTRL